MFNTSSVIEQIEAITKHKKYWFQQQGKDLDLDHLEVNLKDFKKDRDAYIKKLNGIYQENLEKSGVDHINGLAEFVDNHTIKCNEQTYTADHILIATGSRANKLGIEGEEYTIDSDGFFDLDEVPKRALVVGGGYIGKFLKRALDISCRYLDMLKYLFSIGVRLVNKTYNYFGIACELAQILTLFGSKTTILVRDKVLASFDQEVAEKLILNFGYMGLTHKNGELIKIEKNEDGSLKATLKNGEEIEVDLILVAVGRHPLIETLKLEKTDIKLTEGKKAIETDDFENTSVEGVYAVGDVNGKIELTPVAIRAGRCLSERLFNGRHDLKMNYEYVPSVIFSHPPIASCGYSEEKAREKFGDENIEIYKTEFKSKSS